MRYEIAFSPPPSQLTPPSLGALLHGVSHSDLRRDCHTHARGYELPICDEPGRMGRREL